MPPARPDELSPPSIPGARILPRGAAGASAPPERRALGAAAGTA
jgi:hypothetical protein